MTKVCQKIVACGQPAVCFGHLIFLDWSQTIWGLLYENVLSRVVTGWLTHPVLDTLVTRAANTFLYAPACRKICAPCPCLLKEDVTRLQSLSRSLVAIKVLELGAVNAADRLWYLALCCVPGWASSVDLEDSSQNLGKNIPKNLWQLIFLSKKCNDFSY